MSNKRKLGIIGGMGSHATVWLFKRIIELSPALIDQDYPDIIVLNNSSTPDRTQAILYGGESPLPYLKKLAMTMNDNNVDLMLLACMTSYYYYDELTKIFRGKILNPIELVVKKLSSSPDLVDKRKIGLIGSSGLIKSGLYQKTLESLGYRVLTLDDEDQEEYFMKPIYMEGGIKSGVLDGDVKNMFLHQIPLLRNKGAELIIGACSEVPLVVTGDVGVPFIDAFELLAKSAVDYCYNKKDGL